MTPVRLIALLVLCLAMSGCKVLPTYRPTSGEALADVKLSPNLQNDKLQMCDGGTCYQLLPVDGHVRVPANRRIALYKSLVASGYQVTYSCSPGVTFVPRTEVNYYADFALRAEKCQFGVYRIDAMSRVGIRFEPTVRSLSSG